MELRHLRYLVATARAGGVTAAAAELHLTQPGLSRQLRDLERELGVDLFERRPGPLRLSRAGEELLPLAAAALDAADELRRAAALRAEGRLSRLLVAAPTVTLTDVVAPFVAGLAIDDPVVDARVADGVTARAMLLDGVDLALAPAPAAAPFVARPLATLPVWACVAPAHPWAARGTVGVGELADGAGGAAIVVPPAFTARAALETALAASGRALGEHVEAGTGALAQALAAAGRGVAIVSDEPRFGLRPVRLADDDGRPVVVRLHASWDPRPATGATVEALVDRLAAFVDRAYPAA
ncbi:LysR family transcriptional regulator [Nocardioides sp. TRM66260-LWL]|uniref:LysR family transcriptional regulator n=1 Tax=Nocardioides sp. TRM66260-LWL TaxID=2874478 RepID=UPI001CC390A1|nr:LysR family transcriptional regulator [Nocardioides sp. TRM66260-LWL]MBZ5735054.1 LysR family transcriptional regulator [Nocardioides sp. TRM66260-LWL]